ncbi:MAG: 9-O-acetylesterase [Bacteroidales bacterium]|nr:9-O-acetylesterase [Bacteroidales bacterium]
MNLIKFFVCGALIFPLAASAKVTLPQFFTDSMVVQQKAEITIPGKAKKGATVKITPSWSGETVKAKADKNGKFSAKLTTPDAGGPYSITFDDGQKLTLNDVMAGEVWFCSGQSNMEMPVDGWGKVMDYRREVAEANSPNLRLLQIKKATSYSPQEDAEVNMGGWRSATPKSVPEFSSIGYFFGRQLNNELDIPIGIIDCTWGGTPVEAWSSYELLNSLGEFGPELQKIEDNNYDASALLAAYEQQMEEWDKMVIPQNVDFEETSAKWATMPVPGVWEDSVLPAFDGIVWMRKTFDVPAADAGKAAMLNLACIDDEDITYLNGQKVGAISGYNVERSYEIPAGALKAGENTVLVRVLDTGGGGGIYGNADDVSLVIDGTPISLAGDWEYTVASDFGSFPPRPVSPLSSSYPTVLYNAMMHPVTVMPVAGVLWYQGCANVGRDEQYSKVFKGMIEDWRKDWNNPELPFYFVQLAGYLQPKRFQPNSEWAALRQAQANALTLNNTGMAVAIDLGNPDDIHPKNKQEVARRLAAMALNDRYGKKQPCRAPEVKSTKVDGRYVRLTFNEPVTMYGGGQGFVIKGKDGEWAVAYGRQLSPTEIEVSSDEVASPVELRYDWADYPEGNLRSLSGLPVAPFKTK